MLRHTDLDVAKRVFQMYWVDAQTGEIVNRRFGRDELIRFLAQRPAGRVALEACGSGHWWARKIRALGHEVVLLHAKFIRPFVQTNKTDAADARAIWTAVQQPGMRTVAAKTEDQQAMLSLHRMRALLVKFRTMQVNQLRGLLYEFGATFRAGRVAGLAEIRARMAELEDALPATDDPQSARPVAARIDRDLSKILISSRGGSAPGRNRKRRAARSRKCRASAGSPRRRWSRRWEMRRRSSRDASLLRFSDLVPRQSGTGGKVRLGSISKRGDPYLRTLLIHGARSVMCHAKVPTAWQKGNSSAATCQRSGGGAGQQDGANGVGDSGPWTARIEKNT